MNIFTAYKYGFVRAFKNLKWIKYMNLNKHCKGDWYELVCSSLTENGLKYNNYPLPGFPDDEIQIRTTGRAGAPTLCEAYLFYEDCINKFKESSNFAKPERTLMDFGAGWGRILRFFIKEIPPQQLYGVEINPELLEICRSTFEYSEFIKSDSFPPINIESESFDFIVGYSVFSHLSEDACLAWVEEFYRLLRPGGMLALTTRGRWFLDYCEDLKTADGYPSALNKMFANFDDARNKYDRGEFVHSNADGVSGSGPLNSNFYGETFIPEAYAKKVYSKYFEVLPFEFTPGRTTHPIMFFRKAT